LAALAPLFIAGCSDIDTDPTYGDKTHDTLYKNGSLMSDEGGLSIFGDNDKGKGAESGAAGIGVNAFLWRATLDTINFMPIQSADPFGGVILTDWYSPPDTPNERTKLNIFIRDRDLRADGVKISIFRQTKNEHGDWIDATVSPSTSVSLENAILTRARQIRLAQKQFQ
jgi:hypothetical protein